MTTPLTYPPGDAENIAKARLRRQRPAGTVLIALTGRHDVSNPQMFPEIGKAYRWDFLKGLGVVVLKNQNHDLSMLVSLLQDIDDAQPAQLDLVDINAGKGWMVLFTNPLRTIRWTEHQVTDWLGGGEWHRELQAIKDRSRELTAAIEKQKSKVKQEPVWN
jgi:hypothetical protein